MNKNKFAPSSQAPWKRLVNFYAEGIMLCCIEHVINQGL